MKTTTISPSDVNDALQRVFGFQTFRPNQEAIVHSLLTGRDVFAVMPTGGGKSLCYQLPAHLLDGLCVVISPLISLMKDQVDSAKANGLRAEFLNSTLQGSERQHVLAQLNRNELDLLYVSPERFAMPDFIELLQASHLSFFAIDEAHCISEWGHDFRPDYLLLSKIIPQFPNATVAAFTATATHQVADDIKTKLALRNPYLTRASFDRPNLFYQVVQKENLDLQILHFLREHPNQSGIIYRTTRKSVEATATFLQEQGINARAYHAGLTPAQRQQNQDLFNRDEIEVIVATIAFGMGIDKSNVRFVLHGDLPKNMEGYYQETGRAGRDGEPAHCRLFFSRGDLVRLRYFIDQIEDPREKKIAEEQLFTMVRFAEANVCRRKSILGYFGETYEKENCKTCDVCMGEVECVDATVPAQKIMSAIYRTDQQFGAAHIADIVCGANTAKIRQFGHDQLKTYGAGKDQDKKYWRSIIDALLAQESLRQNPDHFSALEILPKGKQILLGKKSFEVLRKKRGKSTATTELTSDYSQELFSFLRNERLRIAQAACVPPFIIFSDRTLREMALYFPDTPEKMARISGVGDAKLKKYGDTFMTIIEMYKHMHPKEAEQRALLRVPVTITTSHKKKKSQTVNQSRELAAQGLSLDSIAELRGLATGTISQHIEKWIEDNGHGGIELDQLIGAEKRTQIERLFSENPTASLAQLIEKSDHTVDYAELRVARAVLSSTQ